MSRERQAGLAWCGWQVRIPAGWRPLRIYGDGKQGSMIVGNADAPVFRIRWQVLSGRNRDPLKWRARRTRALGPGLSAQNVFDASLEDFPSALRVESEKGWVWQGLSPRAELVVEVLPDPEADGDAARIVSEQIIPTLRAVPRTDPVPWRILGARFETPPGFSLTRHRLHLGDMALELFNENHERIVVRQVYPAELALQRRSLEEWLTIAPFETRRRIRRTHARPGNESTTPAPTVHEVRMTGASRIPWPLGFVRPRRYAGTAVLDADNDRILIAEAELRQADPRAVLPHLIRGMREDRKNTNTGPHPLE